LEVLAGHKRDSWVIQESRAPHIAARPAVSDSSLPPRGEAAGGGRCRNEVSAEPT